jgi:hypothetical protein
MRVLRSLPSLGISLLFCLIAGVVLAQTKSGGGPPLGSPPGWQRTTNTTAVALGAPLLLTDGTVIIQDPEASDWWKLTPDVTGSYVNGTWSQIGSLPSGYGPLYFASAVLADGRVVVIGGEYNVGQSGGVWTNKGAIYNPLTNAWANLAAPSGWANIGDAQCCVLPDGRFLLAQPANRQIALLNPATLTWTALQGTGKTDRFDEEGWTLLPEGSLLTCCAINAPLTEKYIISADQWVTAGNTPQRLEDQSSQELGPAVLRPNGTVFAMGATGHNAVYTPGQFATDPGTWTGAPDFPVAPNGQLDIADGPACLLPSGNVLCYASPGVFHTPSSFFEFDGTNLNAVATTPNSAGNPSYVGNMLMLPTGQVLFTDFSNDVEIYTPSGTPQNSWRPTITACPTTVASGQSFILQGRQLNGLSQCSAYGDDSTNATNYPLVRITNIATGHIRYCRTHDHSTMAVATGNAIVATHVDVPAGVELGASRLEVVTNGIASNPLAVVVTNKVISGHVTLQDWTVPSTYVPVTIEIRAPGTTTPIESQSILLDANGNFQIATTVANGTYDITAKSSHWLRKKVVNQTITGPGASGLSFALVNGDVNGDNFVTLADFTQLRAAFGTVTTGPEDLNGDGTVTLSDFTILRANFAQAGDN